MEQKWMRASLEQLKLTMKCIYIYIYEIRKKIFYKKLSSSHAPTCMGDHVWEMEDV